MIDDRATALLHRTAVDGFLPMTSGTAGMRLGGVLPPGLTLTTALTLAGARIGNFAVVNHSRVGKVVAARSG